MPDVAHSYSSLTVPAARDDIVIPKGSRVIPMGTIRERRRKTDGSIGYTAQIILKRKGKPTYREAQTFDRRGAAAAWLKLREAEIKEAGSPEAASGRRSTLADGIDRYLKESRKEIGRTKAQVLEAIKRDDIADLKAADVGSQDIVAFAKRLSRERKPQTVGNYISHLSAVFAIAEPAWGIPLSRQAMKDAMAVLGQLGLISKSEKRDRRPTLGELDKLMEFFTDQWKRGQATVPMARVIPFALFSTRRLGEIVRIEWGEWDPAGSRILVRDMKHPGQKIGNDIWCDLPDEAMAFMGQPAKTGRIFPYTDDAISAAFTRACQVLGIEDLHFHDLRHEGVSRLFEMGRTIPHVAAVSGHRSWQSLQRYTHLRQTGDKYAGWKWLSQ